MRLISTDIRCVVASALCAVNYEVVDLPGLGMEQDRVALST